MLEACPDCIGMTYIPEMAKRRVFFDARPNPTTKGELPYFPFAHCKTMYIATPRHESGLCGIAQFFQIGMGIAWRNATKMWNWELCLPRHLRLYARNGSLDCPVYFQMHPRLLHQAIFLRRLIREFDKSARGKCGRGHGNDEGMAHSKGGE